MHSISYIFFELKKIGVREIEIVLYGLKMSFWNGNEKSPIFVGPWGGEGGSPWDDGVYATTRQVEVVHGAAIDSIRIEYHKKGSSVWSEKHGGNGGTKTDKCGVVKVGPWGELKPQNLRDIEGIPTQLTKIIIRYSGCIESIKFQYVADGVAKWSSTWGSESGSTAEIDLGNNHYLTAISGYYGNYFGYIVIRSLTFVSTMGTHGPYGPKEGTAFSLPVKAGKVVGFFGRAGQWLDALGFYLKPTLA
ncbi:putative Horcolin [Cocos nucifera]|uniref:Putative Horcolin n=1 Tax=Cocos nucifera TaxID=13894 RepID=A0A8K0N301_COCNU|nr:putative Horcolin [Cocos nucifera]